MVTIDDGGKHGRQPASSGGDGYRLHLTAADRQLRTRRGSQAAGCTDVMTDNHTTLMKAENVVVHFADGGVTKGQTDDFSASRPTFTLIPIGAADHGPPVVVRL